MTVSRPLAAKVPANPAPVDPTIPRSLDEALDRAADLFLDGLEEAERMSAERQSA